MGRTPTEALLSKFADECRDYADAVRRCLLKGPMRNALTCAQLYLIYVMPAKGDRPEPPPEY